MSGDSLVNPAGGIILRDESTNVIDDSFCPSPIVEVNAKS